MIFPWKRIVIFLAGATFVVLCAFPLVWTALESFKPTSELFSYPPKLLPENWTLDNYFEVFTQTNVLTYFFNSTLIALIVTPLTALLASLGAWSLARFNYRFRDVIARLVLFTYMLPSIMICIPLYVIMARAGLADTHLALVIAYTTISLPFAMWLLRAFHQGIPEELEQAAMTDGATRLQAFRDIIFPLSLPGVIAVSIWIFIVVFTEYIYALVLISTEAKKTLAIGLAGFMGQYFVRWNYVLASVTFVSIPILIFFILIQRHLVKGTFAGSIKG